MKLALRKIVVALIFVGLLPTAMVVAQSRPNIILINMDDADAAVFEQSRAPIYFPRIMDLADRGIMFTNMHVTTPLCGPSRACLYRAQYAHNTGVRVNQASLSSSHNFDGGFRFYREQGYFQDDLSVWMKQAGYRTMLVGKFLHDTVEDYVPPGWDDFVSYWGSRYYGTYCFTNLTQAAGSRHRIPEDVYRTIAETNDAVSLIRRHRTANPEQPFFLNINPLGPHRGQVAYPEMIDRRRAHWWPRMHPPFSHSYNELDIRDKRGLLGQVELLPDWAHLYATEHYRERAIAIRSVDDMVGQIVDLLAELEIDDNTYIFITSDNGMLLGHHRIIGKGLTVDRATRVPLIVIGPGVPSGRQANHLMGHIDLAPTFVDLAEGQVPDFVDGQSFAKLLTHDGLEHHQHFRKFLLIQNWRLLNTHSGGYESAATALRSPDSIYTEWADGDRDFFDLVQDPDQLNNTYDELTVGMKLFLSTKLRNQMNRELKAHARFSVPFEFDEVIPKRATLRGLAEDPIGVNRVRLAIWDIDKNRYWSGRHWEDSFTQVNADLENWGGQLTFWNYDLRLGSDLPKRLATWVWAFDEANQFSAPSMAVYELDFEPPALTLIRPTPNQQFDGDVVISGTVFDNVDVPEARLFIRNLVDKQFWNGTGFQDSPVYLPVEPDSKGRWKTRVSLPDGHYRLIVNAVDTSSNAVEEQPTVRFSVVK